MCLVGNMQSDCFLLFIFFPDEDFQTLARSNNRAIIVAGMKWNLSDM